MMKSAHFKTLLLSLVPLAFLAAETRAELISPTALREQFNTNIISAIEAIEREGHKTAGTSIFTTTTPGMLLTMMLAPWMGYFDDDELTRPGKIKALLNSSQMDSLFAQKNIVERSDKAVSFKLGAEICSFADHASEQELKACGGFFESNFATIQLSQTASQGVALKFFYAAKDKDVGKEMFGITTAANSFGAEVALDGMHQFLDHFKLALPANDAISDLLPDLERFEGTLKVAVQFENPGTPSGCDDNGSICLIFNVVDPVFIESRAAGNTYVIKTGSSEESTPSFRFSGNGDSVFSLFMNLKGISYSGESDFGFDLPGLTGTIRIPQATSPGESVVELNGFGFGPGTFSISGWSKLALDLNKNANRIVDHIKLMWREENGLTLESSHADLQIDSTPHDDGCHASEQLSIKIGGLAKEIARLVLSQSSPRYSEAEEYRECSPVSNLQSFSLSKLVKTACTPKSAVTVERGSLDLSYTYNIEKDKGASSASASDGECLDFGGSQRPADHDEL